MRIIVPAPGQVRVPLERVRAVTSRTLELIGASSSERAIVTKALIAADLRGQHSHGVLRLPTIIGRAKAGLIVPGAVAHYQPIGPAMGVLDGAFGFGHVTATVAADRAMDLARTGGIGLVLVRASNHIGMLAHYLKRIAEAGLISLILTTTEPFVRPAGGSEPLLGTNPIGIGFPAKPPFLLDMSTGTTAIGKLLDARQRGQCIPPTWAIDRGGQPTTDPAEALLGAINPVGGVKGYGLSLAVALLAGVLTGTSTGRRVTGTLDSEHPATKGDLFLALDPSMLPWGSEVPARATGYLDEMRASRPTDPADPVLVPGDRGRAAEKATGQDGHLTLSAEVWSQIEALAVREDH